MLEKVIGGKGIVSFGQYAFFNCVKLTELSLGKNIKLIGNAAFTNTGLKNVDLPEGLKSVGGGAFHTVHITERPEGAIIKYTVTFHGNGLTFTDGTTENSIVYTSAGQVLDGQYKIPNGINVCWYTDKSCTTRVPISRDGTINIGVSKNIDLYAKEATFVLKSGDTFNSLIPDETTAIYFTDEEMPDGAETIDVDADGDSGAIAWMEGTVMKVSTQISDVKVISNVNSKNMFSKKVNLEEIHFDNIDTSATTNMQSLFLNCSKLKTLDLTTFNTSKVNNMEAMFYMCSNLLELDIDHFDTKNVTNMSMMFLMCSKLNVLNVKNFDTGKVTDMSYMFSTCQSLTELNVSSFNTSNVKNMMQMFYNCNNLITLNLSSFDTSNVTNMNKMWYNCKSLTMLDLSNFNTTKVTAMDCTFYACHGMTILILGENFRLVGETYSIPASSWMNSSGEIFESDGTNSNLPSNVADTYKKMTN